MFVSTITRSSATMTQVYGQCEELTRIVVMVEMKGEEVEDGYDILVFEGS